MKQTIRYRASTALLVLLAFMGGADSVCIKLGLRELPPFYFCFLRFVLAFILLLPLLNGAPTGIVSVLRWKLHKFTEFVDGNYLSASFIYILTATSLFTYLLTTHIYNGHLYSGPPLITPRGVSDVPNI